MIRYQIRLTIIIAISITFNLFANDNEFVIGTFWDPLLSGNSILGQYKDIDSMDISIINQHIANFQQAKNAYFNLFTASQDGPVNDTGGYIRQDFGGMKYALYIASQVKGLNYLVNDGLFYGGNTASNTTEEVKKYLLWSDGGQLNQNGRDALLGYYMWDEPPFLTENTSSETKAEINNLKIWNSTFIQTDPNKKRFINLLPIYAKAFVKGATNDDTTISRYTEYVKYYLNQVKPTTIGFDHYPFEYGIIKSTYFRNLEIIRDECLPLGIPFWAYPMTVEHENLREPNFEEVMFMAFCPIAYGAQGLIYFTYGSPDPNRPEGFKKALIDGHWQEGDKNATAKYFQVKNINHYISKILGPIVMTCQSKNVVKQDNLLLGHFVSNDNSSNHYLFVVNIANDTKNLKAIKNIKIRLKSSDCKDVKLAPEMIKVCDDLYQYNGNEEYLQVKSYKDLMLNETVIPISHMGPGTIKVYRFNSDDLTIDFEVVASEKIEDISDIDRQTINELSNKLITK